MDKSERERGSMLPDQKDEIKFKESKEKQDKRDTFAEPQEDFPIDQVEKDEKADRKKTTSYKDIETDKEKEKDQ
ncbi:hypothetical protein ERJ70_01290 [Sediminibacillus dalangtanensis]|uniref:Uncharacterized protein n=1 Tax=Sediminibacillus dalangtanensis TaxID=2729421 RepID=A0ABX7VNQ2_9BACI|nr:hypothetical protein [Sediminibacillus dalangtanensis]QTM98073.1 hypothetical protein ERJ70_01290 [Sediminibacillus dalangtanensis]